MKKIRLYQNTIFNVGDKVELNKDNDHHLSKVLRFPTGKDIILFNGNGVDYIAKVLDSKKMTHLEIISEQKNDNESKLELTLAQGIAKGEKMDFLIQKAIELINSIIEEPEVGEVYEGKVVKIMEFGAFVNFFGKKDGLVHISQLSEERVEKVTDVINEGDTVKVKVIGFDKGKVKLSIKDVDA